MKPLSAIHGGHYDNVDLSMTSHYSCTLSAGFAETPRETMHTSARPLTGEADSMPEPMPDLMLVFPRSASMVARRPYPAVG